MDYIAHIRESDQRIQTVEEHLLGVKELAEIYGEKIGFKHLAGLAGVLHDLGKYTDEFKNYIIEAVNNPLEPPKRGSVDHSTAGGKLLFEKFHKPTKNKEFEIFKALVAEIVGNSIISHHSYLQDFLTPNLESNYLKRVQEKELSEFNHAVQRFFNQVMNEDKFYRYVDRAADELEKYLKKPSPLTIEEKLLFASKFIFSCLIDADRTNTRLFEENKREENRNDHGSLFEKYYERLMSKIHSFKNDKNANNPINVLRNEMSNQCEQFAEKPSGIYTLSIPTGGGKTLASLRYALKHAIKYNKKRIVYVLPFTTIIEQNAEEVRNILQDRENILEHHSNVVEEESVDDERQDGIMTVQQKLKLAKDNWDSPIIFTTMVQFLNTFYADGNRNIRRLHNLAEAIIIFDEVQKVPVSSVSLFNKALNFLKNYCKTSMILCTATQPALDYVDHSLDIDKNAEIVSNIDSVIDAFKRVNIVDLASDKTFSNHHLASFIQEKINEVESVLVILNTKKVVKELYKILKEEETIVPIYHLSTAMCAAHRNKILAEIREKLFKKEKIICISTQLIEAGVDVSFQCVIRSLAGLDSIAQAAGRCNRHGEKELQNVYIINHEEEKLDKLKEIKVGKRITKNILRDLRNNPENHGGNLLSRQAMGRYFQEFYTDMDSDLNYFIPKLKKNMTELLIAPKQSYSYHQAFQTKNRKPLPLFIVNSYKTAAEHFRVIADHTKTVIVPYGEGKEIIADLSGEQTIEDLTKLLRKAQQYSINLYSNEWNELAKNDGIVSYLDGRVFVLKEGAYSEEYGINLENDSVFDSLMF